MGDPDSGANRNHDSGPVPRAAGRQSGSEASSESEPATGWRARLFVFLSVGFLWLAMSWSLTFHHALLLFLWPVSALLVVWLSDRLGVVTDETTPLELTFTTLAYVPWLAWQVVTSSLTVLRHAWWPGVERNPKTARIESSARTELGLASYANSITLTPGTLSLEAESLQMARAKGGDSAWILVHSLTPQGLEDLRAGAMDQQIVRVEKPLRRRLEKQQKKTAGEDG